MSRGRPLRRLSTGIRAKHVPFPLPIIAKYAEASSAAGTLFRRDGELTFGVTDDGRGFDASQTGYGSGLQGISERLVALAGRVEIESEIGSGTTVAGVVPAEEIS
jgi:signal transduction histidine kinase